MDWYTTLASAGLWSSAFSADQNSIRREGRTVGIGTYLYVTCARWGAVSSGDLNLVLTGAVL